MTAVPPLRTLLRPLRVAVLNSPGSGSFSYAPLLGDLLRSAVSTPSLVEVTAFDTEARSLPPLSFDGYVLSGSRHGVYDRATLPWVEDLVQWSKAALASRARLVGICFGHQVIAEALGGRVEVNPAGFELGVLPMPLSEAARARLSALAGCPAPPSLVMQYVHGDVVSSLPPGVHSMGGTSLSPNNGFVAPGALCFQGHPEFSSAIVQDIILRLVERGTVPQRLPAGVTLEGVRNSLYSPVDSHFVAAALVGHLLGE